MSVFLDRIIMRGHVEGRIEGEQKGRVEGMKDATINMYRDGIPFDTIVKITNQPANTVTSRLGMQTA